MLCRSRLIRSTVHPVSASLLADPCFLPEAEFHEQPAALVQVGRSISQQLTNHAEAVNSGIQSGSGLVISDLWLQSRCVAGRNIRRIGNDHVGGMFDSVEKVSGHQRHAAGHVMPVAIPVRHRKRRHRYIGRDHLR